MQIIWQDLFLDRIYKINMILPLCSYARKLMTGREEYRDVM